MATDYTPSYWDEIVAEAVDYIEVDEEIQLIDYRNQPFQKLLNKIGEETTETPEYSYGYEGPDIVNFTITGFDTDGDGTGINGGANSTVGFFPGDLIQAVADTNARDTEKMRIASVDSTTELTVVRDACGSTGVTLVVGDILRNVGGQHQEGGAATREYYTPATLINNIYVNSALVSRTLIALATKTRMNQTDWEDMKILKEFKKDFERQAFFGKKHAGVAATPWWSSDGLYEAISWAHTNDGNMDHIVSVAEAAFGEEAWRAFCQRLHTYGDSREKWLFVGKLGYEQIYLMYKDRHSITTNDFLDFDVHRVPTFQGDWVNVVEHRMLDDMGLHGWIFGVDPAYIAMRKFIPFISWPIDFTSHGVTQKGHMVFGAKGFQCRNPYSTHLLKIT